MNKYFIIGGIIVLILIAGVVYRLFLLPEGLRPVTTGVVREITVTTGVDQWNFFPETIEVDRGDKIIMTLINEDPYDEGWIFKMEASGEIMAKFLDAEGYQAFIDTQ